MASAVRYLRAAAHLGHFLDRTGVSFAAIDAGISESFRRHLPNCRCPLSNGGINHHVVFGVKRFLRYLVQFGVCASEVAGVTEPSEPPLIAGFRRWLEVHRGVAPPTVKQYCRGAGELLDALGTDPSRWNAQQVRAQFLEPVAQGGAATIEKRVTAVRAFLRYLIAQGQCQADLDRAVPVQAHWRLASLPQSLTSEQLERLIGACEGDSCNRRRDRAIVLLLARLGLRAGDVARMRLVDLDWDSATVQNNLNRLGWAEVRGPTEIVLKIY